MKKPILLLIFSILTISVFTQVPQKISYQSIIRDESSNLISNQTVGIRISIIQHTIEGTIIYSETHLTETNTNGLITIEIGSGDSSDDFSLIDWSDGPYFLKTETDINGGSEYTISGTSQLLSVPYALYAETANNVENIDITGDETAFDLWDKDNTDDFSGNYNDLTNKPDFSNWDTDVNDDFDGDYLNLVNAPDFTGWDTNETDDFSGSYNDLTDIPVNLDIDYTDDFSGDYNDLTNLPDFTNWDTDVNDDFDGQYDNLTGAPANVSFFTNDAGYITEEIDSDITNEIQTLSSVLTEGNTGGNTQIKEIANPTEDQDAVTKAYLDAIVDILVETGNIVMADFTSNVQLELTSNDIQFTSISDINPTNWYWDFGDGNTSTEENPLHAYSSSGIYTVSLTLSNDILTYEETKTDYIEIILAGIIGSGVTDYDGNFYPSVIIGSQEWMAENLKVTHYPNGDPIPYITDNSEWAALNDTDTDDAYSYLSNNEESIYGAFYTYAAAIGDNWERDNVENQGVCPDGWHIPTDLEIQTLEISLGMYPEDSDIIGWRGGYAEVGYKLKSQNGWASGDASTNSTGFSFLPGCARSNSSGSFVTNDCGYLWTATPNISSAFLRMLGPAAKSVDRQSYAKSNGFSVRCVKN